MKEDDIDQPLEVFEVNGRQIGELWIDAFDDRWLGQVADHGPAQFGDALLYLGYQRLNVGQGQLVMATLWQALRPVSQAVIFTHVLGADGLPLAQADRLDAPGDYWMPGDLFIQLHQVDLPNGLPVGNYPLAVGVYTSDTMQRLPLIINGRESGDHLLLPEVAISS
jgi:hypothetical protein